MMRVLVDTSVWTAHYKGLVDGLTELLLADRVLMHPLILGEIACGTPPDRVRALRDLGRLAEVPRPSPREVLAFIEREMLYGKGCGIVDLTLLAATLLGGSAQVWTLDKRLADLAQRFGVLYVPPARVH